ncbi:uncharacterized protein LOC113295946 [Papaver somniferum]|uniref:uncharacterized protein LOC113295946 n=1 Tax=Papaver somniferum TaxID=3469 RepID=UPI000E6FD876|nr:uncharacterized protein LOC113295946 [Papaver somniferum]
MVWVHFPDLSLEYWDEETLFKLSRALGTPVKVDDATLNYQSGYYARVSVEIDLAKTIPNNLWIITKYGCFSQSVVLTNLPKFCWKCKIVGHQHSDCRAKTQPEKPIEQVPSTRKQQEVPQTPKVVMEPFDIAPTPEKDDSAINEVELSPSKILKVVQDNALDNSVVKYVNSIDGTVSSERIPFTSWSRVVQRPSIPKSPTINNEEASKEGMAIHNSVNHNKGNIWVFWNKDLHTPSVVFMSSQMITISIGDVLISGIHAHVG